MLTTILAVDQRSVRYAAFTPTRWYAYGTGERLSIPATDEEVLFFWRNCTNGDDGTFTDLTFEQKLLAAHCLLSKYPGPGTLCRLLLERIGVQKSFNVKYQNLEVS